MKRLLDITVSVSALVLLLPLMLVLALASRFQSLFTPHFLLKLT